MSDTNSIKITALLFGQAREFVGASSLDVEVAAPATVESVFAILKSKHPRLAQMERSLLFAVNKEYPSLAAPWAAHDGLAIRPPVGGGKPKNIFEITREPIDIAG